MTDMTDIKPGIVYRSDVELVKREFPGAYALLMQKVEQGKTIIIESL